MQIMIDISSELNKGILVLLYINEILPIYCLR